MTWNKREVLNRTISGRNIYLGFLVTLFWVLRQHFVRRSVSRFFFLVCFCFWSQNILVEFFQRQIPVHSLYVLTFLFRIMERPALNLPRIQSRKITLDGVQLWNLNRSTTEEIFLLAVSSSGVRTGMEWKWEPFWILCRLFPYWKMSFKHQRLLLPHMWFVWLTIKLLSNSAREYFLVNHSFTVPSFEKFWWVNSSPGSLFFTFNDKGGKEERDWEGG